MTNAARSNEATPQPQLNALFETFGTRCCYDRGGEIMRFDAEQPSLFLLVEGTAALQLTDQDQGTELNVTHLVPGSIFGSLEPGQAQRNRIGMHIFAKAPSTVYLLREAQLAEAIAADPQAMFAVFSELSRTSMRSLLKVGQFAFFDVRGRVSSVLAELCELPGATPHPEGYVVKNTCKEIASMAGCTREMVGRVIKELAMAGYLKKMSGRQLLIHTSST
ncbi:helix-turn-helix domain-containing protein [Pseudomonas guariconensis]|uniref:helix-turn-helix domain-containing protein n=1 Tax=Pseudomonas guariconensis TaxID=1288410 RepID=UPI003905F4E8